MTTIVQSQPWPRTDDAIRALLDSGEPAVLRDDFAGPVERTFVGIDEAFGGDGAPDTLHIMGDAYVDGGVLKLTDAAVLKAGGKNGWLLFNLPPPRPALWQWRIEFDVYVGGGTGGEGFSVVYGPLPDLYALEFQGGISHMGPSTTHDFLGSGTHATFLLASPRERMPGPGRSATSFLSISEVQLPLIAATGAATAGAADTGGAAAAGAPGAASTDAATAAAATG